MKYIVAICFIFFCSLSLHAQESRYRKALADYQEESYKKAYKKLKKALEHKETRHLPEVLLLNAKIILALEYDEKFTKELPRPLLESLKFAEKAVKKSKSPAALLEKEAAFFSELEEKVLARAGAELEKGRAAQAQKYYLRLHEMNGSLQALWGEAKVALALQDTVIAVEKAGKLVERVFIFSEDTAYRPEVNDEPFLFLTAHYIAKKRYDTAAYISERSLNIYPESAGLKAGLLKAFLLHVTQSSPAYSTLEHFASMRTRFREDSLFLHKENVLFLYLLNTYSNQGLTSVADSLLAGFIDLKNSYYEEFGAAYRKKDPLYDPDNNKLIFNLIRYSAKFEREAFLSLLLKNYIGGGYATAGFRSLSAEKRWKDYFSAVEKERSVFLLYTSLPFAAKELNKEKWFLKYRQELIHRALLEADSFHDRAALLQFIPFVLKEYPGNREVFLLTRKLSLSMISEYIDSSYFSHAQLCVIQHERLLDRSPELKPLKRKLGEKDFIANYYGSRLMNDSVNGKLVSEFVWNGNEANCDAGGVPVKVQEKVEQRINYFRRTARVPDYVQLIADKNRKCQYAALLYQVNNIKKAAKPAESWKCYSAIAGEGALMSARVSGQTSVFAVTSVMADLGDDNIALGNRRWLLFPPAREMGHGSTSRVALIWTLDESGKKDSSEYMKDFVSWPPRDFCPTMFRFERWHFSMYADMSKATISLSSGTRSIPVKQENLQEGYGMPSLVWKPLENLEDEVEYTVTIKNILLHGEKKPRNISYTVTFFDPMKNRQP
jgi:hypothetical protein